MFDCLFVFCNYLLIYVFPDDMFFYILLSLYFLLLWKVLFGCLIFLALFFNCIFIFNSFFFQFIHFINIVSCSFWDNNNNNNNLVCLVIYMRKYVQISSFLFLLSNQALAIKFQLKKKINKKINVYILKMFCIDFFTCLLVFLYFYYTHYCNGYHRNSITKRIESFNYLIWNIENVSLWKYIYTVKSQL